MRTRIILALALGAILFPAPLPDAGAGSDGPSAPASQPRKKMPGTITLGSISGRYEPVVFDHAEHVEMAGGCGECHHQHGSVRVLECRECHQFNPAEFRKNVKIGKIRACKDCHPASPQQAAGGPPGLKAAYHRACFGCHTEVGPVGEDPKGCARMCHAKQQGTPGIARE